MGTIETFDHTADVGLRIRADDLDDLFRSAARGLFDAIVVNRDQVRVESTETIDLQAESPDELLVDWLNELLFRCETRHRLYGRFEVAVADDGRSLQGTIGGEPIDPQRHLLDHEVKAITEHGLTLRREADHWLAEVILDI
jgi:SHS2 domain-containing protein